MSTFTEDDLQITFPNVVSARKFDGPDHGLSHCMMAVCRRNTLARDGILGGSLLQTGRER